ncbi:unnamed protein product [Adineta steineri]|uniref:Uncharacterized protein n=1 Tax=Adineta steineri TaxID=433720 RepID=A0A819B143_9BILA|nr:unnamed protein product [Adineta steineri]CAF3794093.1 unnamed protein product [Adineta steineri]
MKSITIFLYFLLILFVQIEQQQAIPTFLLSLEDFQKYPPAWYETVNENEERQENDPLTHYYKRFFNDLSVPHRQRRFGNTKYGRSLTE